MYVYVCVSQVSSSCVIVEMNCYSASGDLEIDAPYVVAAFLSFVWLPNA